MKRVTMPIPETCIVTTYCVIYTCPRFGQNVSAVYPVQRGRLISPPEIESCQLCGFPPTWRE